MLLAHRLDLAYPIYVYSDDHKNLPYVNLEIHQRITGGGTCQNIPCGKCPLYRQFNPNCSSFRITKYFPELLTQYPEYFI